MKRYGLKLWVKKNKIILVICLFLLSAICLSLNYAYSLNIGTLDGVEKVNYSTSAEIDAIDKVLDGVAGNEIEEVIDIVEVPAPEIVVASENETEDPIKVAEKNKGNSGVVQTAKAAVKKYETNETSLGIDVSTYQGNIDWKKVKESGIKFAMIRCGFRRLESGTIVMDNKFEQNIKGAIANNINVGVYFFSMARNETEALEEAAWVLNVIKNYDITYPIATDVEIFNQYRLAGVSYSQMTSNILAFCSYIKKHGYTPMVYSYANALTKYLETGRFKNNRVWLAQYNDTVTYKGQYYMWQYTSNGSVPGISGRVDMDVSYFSVTNDVTKSSVATGVNGSTNLDDIIFKECELKTKLNKEVTLRVSPYNNLPNKAGSLLAGEEITVLGIGKDFIKIIYNDNIFYIEDLNCFDLELEEVSFEKVDLEAILTKKVTILDSPYKFLNNEIRNLNEKMKINIVGLNDNFIKIYLDDKYYYIADVDCYNVLKDNGNLANGS